MKFLLEIFQKTKQLTEKSNLILMIDRFVVYSMYGFNF